MCEFLDISFQLIWVNNRAGIAESYGKSIVSFVRNCQTIFQMTVPFAFPQAMRIPGCFTSLPAFGVRDFGHSNSYMMVSHFNFHFSDDI